MLNITFKGEPYLFVGKSLDDGGALTTPEQFKRGEASYAHFYPAANVVQRYHDVIGNRADIVVLGEAEPIPLTLGDMVLALDNMLGGDPAWFPPEEETEEETP